MAFNDPPEMAGKIPADPKPTRVQATKQPSTSHPKHAIAGPRKAWEAAMQETAAARVALIAATASHRAAETAEAEAMTAWCQHPLNRPDPDAVTRAYLAREGEMRMANKAAGRPVNFRGTVAATDPSPITQAAINRGRHAGGTAQKAGTPLRGNTGRRNV